MKRRQTYYFRDEYDAEEAFTKKNLLEQMKEENITEMHIWKAVIDHNSGMFYCKAIGEVLLPPPDGEPCGKECSEYEPRNGKNGCCISWRHTYTSGTKYLLKSNGVLIPILNNNE